MKTMPVTKQEHERAKIQVNEREEYEFPISWHHSKKRGSSFQSIRELICECSLVLRQHTLLIE